jgi:hypothetical protein
LNNAATHGCIVATAPTPGMGDWWRRADLGEPMNHTTPERGRSDPATPAPFADLVAELGELGFEPQPGPAIPGQVVYAATDSPVTITVVTHPTHPHLRAESAADGHAWHLDWTNHTPVHVQLIALYAILNHTPAAALSAAAAALGTTPPGAEPARRYPAG